MTYQNFAGDGTALDTNLAVAHEFHQEGVTREGKSMTNPLGSLSEGHGGAQDSQPETNIERRGEIEEGDEKERNALGEDGKVMCKTGAYEKDGVKEVVVNCVPITEGFSSAAEEGQDDVNRRYRRSERPPPPRTKCRMIQQLKRDLQRCSQTVRNGMHVLENVRNINPSFCLSSLKPEEFWEVRRQ